MPVWLLLWASRMPLTSTVSSYGLLLRDQASWARIHKRQDGAGTNSGYLLHAVLRGRLCPSPLATCFASCHFRDSKTTEESSVSVRFMKWKVVRQSRTAAVYSEKTGSPSVFHEASLPLWAESRGRAMGINTVVPKLIA